MNRRSDDVGGTWGWVAGIVVIALIAVFLIAGGHGLKNDTASLPPGAPGSTAPAHPSTTTGMGSPVQFPAHRPAAPNPVNPNGQQSARDRISPGAFGAGASAALSAA